MEKSHTLLELEKIEEKYRAEYLQAESIWNVSRNNMIRQALKEGWSYPITELERYTGKRIDEIAVGNGIMMCSDTGECIAGFLWISLAGETKRRGYVDESL